MTHLAYIMSTVQAAVELIGGALYDLGVGDRESALRRLYRARAKLDDGIGRLQIEGNLPKHKTEAERSRSERYS